MFVGSNNESYKHRLMNLTPKPHNYCKSMLKKSIESTFSKKYSTKELSLDVKKSIISKKSKDQDL